MFRSLVLTIICLLVYIPHTSVQDESKPIDENQSIPTKSMLSERKIEQIESLIEILTVKQYRYEAASFALTLNNVLPNFAKYFHELGEEKYENMKYVLRLCQLLNLNIHLKSVSTYDAKLALQLLGPESLNPMNFIQFLDQSRKDECQIITEHLDNLYKSDDETNEKMGPIQLFLKKKMFKQQQLACKLATDLVVRVESFISDSTRSITSIPFSFMYLDTHAAILRSSD